MAEVFREQSEITPRSVSDPVGGCCLLQGPETHRVVPQFKSQQLHPRALGVIHGSVCLLSQLPGHPARNQSQELRKNQPRCLLRCGPSPWPQPSPQDALPRSSGGYRASPTCQLDRWSVGWLVLEGEPPGMQGLGRPGRAACILPWPSPRGRAERAWRPRHHRHHTTLHCLEQPLSATLLPAQGQTMLTAEALLRQSPGCMRVLVVPSALAGSPPALSAWGSTMECQRCQ